MLFYLLQDLIYHNLNMPCNDLNMLVRTTLIQIHNTLFNVKRKKHRHTSVITYAITTAYATDQCYNKCNTVFVIHPIFWNCIFLDFKNTKSFND
jgi:hypothetical protein